MEVIAIEARVRCPHCESPQMVQPNPQVPVMHCQFCGGEIRLFPTKPGDVGTELAIVCDPQWFKDMYGSAWEIFWYLAGCGVL